MDILKNSISQLKNLYIKKEISPVEVLNQIINEISQRDKEIHSFLYLNEKVVAEAKSAEKRYIEGNYRKLEGIPIAVKDNICTIEQPTTCASKILQNYIPPYDATVIRNLKENGAIIIGKTNMDEFAFGSSTENSFFGPTKNPFDTSYVPGGSSGGSAAAVAANLTFGALGSDTGGSIRQPACFCGVVGLKPGYGRVSRYGLVAFGSSLDQIGPITKDVKDSAIILQIISGQDKMDSTCLDIGVLDYEKEIEKEIIPSKYKIGIPKEYFIGGMDKQIKDRAESIIKQLEKQGFILEEISLPHTEYGIAAYYIIATAEASTNLARFDGIRYGYRTKNYSNVQELYFNTRQEGFGFEVKRRIILGTFVLSSGYYDAYYIKAQKVRSLIKNDFQKAFEKVDIILTPTTPELPFKLGEKTSDPLKMYLSDIFTVNVNLAGLPAINIPVGFSRENLPIGVQLITKSFTEEKILQMAYYIENNIK
ncbi:MAG: Asp-tRNA(Asn)/Glu-tRNA(Gln) amidotransferase subunit GatA [Candidatus Omnitrophica bacterium]|jgi:aspartyl-tRNA(Asn)/glutamyl-tRNA(Gln) amidotransferase subunit A|nr:Asp-tRNA(Asn)/Glu-tRNA(Gln) amidotransferase subunit GatA [Candidatus Omnitrophota bacterium]